MTNESKDANLDAAEETTLSKNISGLGQQVLGEVERIGGILTADPITQAEGEFNVEVGEVREEAEESLEKERESND